MFDVLFANYIEELPDAALSLLGSHEFRGCRTLNGDQECFDTCVESIARELDRRGCPDESAKLRGLMFAPNDLKSWNDVSGYYTRSDHEKRFCWRFSKLAGLPAALARSINAEGDRSAYVGD